VDFAPNEPLELESFYAGLEEIGTSIQVGEGEGMYRMHIHVPTDQRYVPIDYCMEIGTVYNIAIENLLAQMEAIGKNAQEQIKLAPLKEGDIATVIVSPGKGFEKIFASLGANAIVGGGQSMNPSTKQVLDAFENLPTDNIIILPNNKNIFMSAQSAADASVKNVKVIESKTVPQGLAAMMRLAPDGDFDTVVQEMTAGLADVVTGEVTTAVRTVDIDGVEVTEGEIIALHNGNLIISAESLEKATLGLFDNIGMAEYEIATLFYGENIGKNEVDKMVEKISEVYPELEVELQYGGQSHYQFMFSIE
jgi:dihydroxyacetone kinase-like predicted kinase